jgi:hypothetical protein
MVRQQLPTRTHRPHLDTSATTRHGIWGFVIYRASHRDYQHSMLLNGVSAGMSRVKVLAGF